MEDIYKEIAREYLDDQLKQSDEAFLERAEINGRLDWL
jgi:hypothetical protein